MQVRTIDTFPDELDDISRLSPTGTFYQSKTWIDSLRATYPRMSFRCLVAEDGGGIQGYLPFFYVKRGPLRTAWSMPFGTYGGPVTVSDDAYRPLLREYEKVLSRLDVVKVGWIDFNNTGPGGEWSGVSCETHRIDISAGFDALWAEKIERQRKKRNRRAERLGVTVRRMQDPEDISRYYAVYSHRLEQWGTEDRYPQEFFTELLNRGGDAVRLYVAYHEDEFLGGHVNFYFQNMVTAWNGVTSVESNHLQPATLLYMHCVREACEEGFTVYNLGCSLGKQSLIDFKESLGGVPYQYVQYERKSLLGKLAAGIKRIGR